MYILDVSFLLLFTDSACVSDRIVPQGQSPLDRNNGGCSSEREDSDGEEGCASPRLTRRHRSRNNRQNSEHMYIDTLPEVS